MNSKKLVLSETSAIDLDALTKVIRPGDTLEHNGTSVSVTKKTFLDTGFSHKVELQLSGGGVLESTVNINFEKMLELIQVNDFLQNNGNIVKVVEKTYRESSASKYTIELTIE